MPRARHTDARADDAAPPRRAMPFVRRRPTDDEIARLEAASYAALDATLAAGTESESAFRSQFKTLHAPPRKPPPDAADAADAAAASGAPTPSSGRAAVGWAAACFGLSNASLSFYDAALAPHARATLGFGALETGLVSLGAGKECFKFAST